MTDQCQPHIVLPVTPAADIAARRFVTWAWAQAVADDDCMGISREKIDANCTGAVITGGTAVVEAGAPLNGTVPQLKADANGRAIACTAGDSTQAVLKPGQTAAALGDLIEVYVYPTIANVS